MSLDPSVFPRANSPASSDSSVPRSRSHGNEEILKKDKNYRRYAATVERALSLFDTALQEWADYISFLSRLLKALQSHPSELNIVPHRSLVAKRLSQCLNPSLPSGVHQKALEVYSYIFSMLKAEGLSRDLYLYLPGIAPTLTFASLSVRPAFLSLIETNIPQLEPTSLRPALKAIILSLLPGLEEETSEDFETTLRIVNKFRDVASQMDSRRGSTDSNTAGSYFWQCLFLASITNPSRRLGVLAYLNRYLPKLGLVEPKAALKSNGAKPAISAESLKSAEIVISPEPGLLIRCFATGLADEQLLVQRNFLDLLVTNLPLHSPILQARISKEDFQKLVIAAAGVVTRRDMSLNRRLWAWFLGPDPPGVSNEQTSESLPQSPQEASTAAAVDVHEHSQSQYFSQFGLDPLVRAILRMIHADSKMPSERSRPLRISLSLMDRWEVGGFVVPAIFLPIMRSVQAYERIASKTHFDEVFRSASAFFDGVESSLIFSELLNLVDVHLEPSVSDIDQQTNRLSLAYFIISNFNIRDEEMLLIHVPLLVLAILTEMESLLRVEFDEGRRLVARTMTQILHKLADLLPEMAFSRKSTHEASNGQPQLSDIKDADILRSIHEFYEQSKDSLDLPPLPFPPRAMGELTLREAYRLATTTLNTSSSLVPAKEALNLLLALLKKVPKSSILRDDALIAIFYECLSAHAAELSTTLFSTISSITSTITTLHNLHGPGDHVSKEQVGDILPLLVQRLWQFLSSRRPKFHVEAVRCLWLLHSISWSDHLVEASLTFLMLDQSISQQLHLANAENAERFFVLWNHSHHWTYDSTTTRIAEEHALSGKTADQDRWLYQSAMLERPLFIVLDLLSQEHSESAQVVRDWLHDLPSIHRVLYMVIIRLETIFNPEQQTTSTLEGVHRTVSLENARQCRYLFQLLSRIIDSLSENGWMTLVSHPVSPVDKPRDVSQSEEGKEKGTFQTVIVQHILTVLDQGPIPSMELTDEEAMLQQTAYQVLKQLLQGIAGERVLDSNIDVVLVDKLSVALDQGNDAVQAAALDTLLAALKLRYVEAFIPPIPPRPSSARHRRTGSRDTVLSASLLSINTEKHDKMQNTVTPTVPPARLLDCLLHGISSPKSRQMIGKWVNLLCQCLPLYFGNLFQILLMLVESFCKEIRVSFNNLQQVFKNKDEPSDDSGSEYVIAALLTGLEACIATAHERLRVEEANVPSIRSPDHPPQGFFGNMVSGVFSTESARGRNTANDRLTVLLCFQDAIKLCFSIWSWGAVEKSGSSLDTESGASFQYTSLRMRNRSRRILENLFNAEALECLETLIEMWTKSKSTENNTAIHVLHLLHTLDAARPKIIIPAVFNAIYSRTNPTALDPSRKSAMASNVTEAELSAFLVTYARSLDDDVLDEIWMDCTTFLKDVLSNPFPHRLILPRLVEFAAILGSKMDNTSFGEDRRTRKELGDLLLRLLTAIFTSKPLGLAQDSGLSGRPSIDHDGSSHAGPDDMLSILTASLPAFITTLGEADRISTAMNNISGNLVGPIIRSRLFPNNVSKTLLSLLQQMSKIPGAAKVWKRDVGEAFNDPRFFSSQLELVQDGWMPILRQWLLVDKDRLPELLSRLTPPTSAGIMFGVGASAARLEADRKAQLNLRRIALLILCANADNFVTDLPDLLQRLEDLLTATNVSSPSSITRAEIFMVLRSLVLKTSTAHLAPFWPLINNEVQDAVCAVPRHQHSELYNAYSLLQACKLLDTLIVLAPDDFQLQEWLFVTDTIDAIYPPGRWEPVALADEVSQSLGSRDATSPIPGDLNDMQGSKQPWLSSDRIRETAKDEIVDRVLKPFFDRLSIYAFENTYGLGVADTSACIIDLLADLFNESTMAN